MKTVRGVIAGAMALMFLQGSAVYADENEIPAPPKGALKYSVMVKKFKNEIVYN